MHLILDLFDTDPELTKEHLSFDDDGPLAEVLIGAADFDLHMATGSPEIRINAVENGTQYTQVWMDMFALVDFKAPAVVAKCIEIFGAKKAEYQVIARDRRYNQVRGLAPWVNTGPPVPVEEPQ